MASPVRVAIVGLGYWGPNLLRNFSKTEGVEVAYGCDLSEKNLDKSRKLYPSTTFTTRYEDVLDDPTVDAVVIATPLTTQYMLTKAALAKGKHVLVEKPFTAKLTDATELLEAAKQTRRILMVDHTFLYEEAVEAIKRYVDGGSLGKLLYYDSTRINLGLLHSDMNVVWDLAVHDLSILDYIRPLSDVVSVTAHGQKYYTDQEEIAHLHLTFKDGMSAHVHVSWLSPVKIRQTLIGGTEKMIVYDDNHPSEKIRLYDKGIQLKKEDQTFMTPIYRSGDVLIPHLKNSEPLAKLAAHFAACIRGEEEPKTPATRSIRILEILSLADESIRQGQTIPR